MKITELFRKTENPPETGGREQFTRPDVRQCPQCKRYTDLKKLRGALMVCPGCGYHYRLGARARILTTVDEGSFTELFSDVISRDPLSFPGYAEKLEAAKAASGESEAVVCGTARLARRPAAVFAMDSGFMMASMGSAVGERLARLFEYASENSLPVMGFCASGGARMQEGALSLMQMAKVSGAVKWHSRGGGLYISVLTDPTTGGVTASFAMLGDIIISEPRALVGFAGRRVVEQTTGRSLPEDFQRAEAALKAGFIDMIVPREDMRKTLIELLKLHEGRRRL